MNIHDMPITVYLDECHSLKFFSNYADETNEVTGCIETHINSDGRPCEGSVLFDVPENGAIRRSKWEVLSWNPLTLAPSLLCTQCGNHGFVRDGKWVPA